MRMLAQLLRRGRYADEVMAIIAQEEMHGNQQSLYQPVTKRKRREIPEVL
jgi:hypothetical protein